ncbi:hypothetical protein [Actinoplanes sp. HUAS TT8]|uniref:hypothetical protein n=1 Tax=Actinoplanes sp. HUAS TT8 TaxID=3447453 RepID=UPI003F51B8EE
MGTVGVNRPQDPGDDRRPPVDPWATIDRPIPTVYLGDPDRTAVGETVHLPGPSAAGETVHLAGPPAVGETVHLAGPPTPTRFISATDATVRAEAEMRFGPGVPAAPAPAAAVPGWPGATPPQRSRPLWRRVVSLLSSLLTLALVAVVGLYLWQRLQPIEVEGVTVAVPKPPGNQCNVTVDVIATVRTNGRSGAIRYQWFRSDTSGGVLTEQVSRGQRSVTLTLRWTFSGTGTTTETATVNIVEPSPIQASTPVDYRCRRG